MFTSSLYWKTFPCGLPSVLSVTGVHQENVILFLLPIYLLSAANAAVFAFAYDAASTTATISSSSKRKLTTKLDNTFHTCQYVLLAANVVVRVTWFLRSYCWCRLAVAAVARL